MILEILSNDNGNGKDNAKKRKVIVHAARAPRTLVWLFGVG